MKIRFLIAFTIPLLLSGCYLPTAIRIKSRLDSDKIASIIAEKACKNKANGYADKDSFDKALLSFSKENIAQTRTNRNILIKITRQKLEKCGIDLKK